MGRSWTMRRAFFLVLWNFLQRLFATWTGAASALPFGRPGLPFVDGPAAALGAGRSGMAVPDMIVTDKDPKTPPSGTGPTVP